MPPKAGSGGPARGLGRNGTRASLACISCRQRKIKCDVQHKAPGMPCSKCQTAQIPCALEPGGDRRRCRTDNTSESLSSLRGRMQALEDMLLKERSSHTDKPRANTQDGHDQESQDDPDQCVSLSPPALHNASPTPDPTASALSVDAAPAGIHVQRNETMSISASDGQSNSHERQTSAYRFSPLPIDHLGTLQTPSFPSPTSNNNTNNTTTTQRNNHNNTITTVTTTSNTATITTNKNNNTADINHDSQDGNHNDDSNRSNNNNVNDFNPEHHQVVFGLGSFPGVEHPMPTSRMQFASSGTGTNPRMDHMNTAIGLENLRQPLHSNDMSQLREQPIQTLDQLHVQAHGISTPSNGDMDSATETDDGRFYGPTSQQYLHSNHEDSPISVANEPKDHMSLDVDSMQVRRLLLQNYWAMHDLCVEVIIDKKRFMADRAAGKRTQYYSTFLENAVLACATRTSTSSAMRELGQRFLERAKAEVSHELEHLSVASMQGFLLLSDFEATRGRDRLGWMFCGIACRSLYDLGLHVNARENRLGSIDKVTRHSVFLTSFVYDQLWSLYLGRPTSISLGFVRTARLAAKDVTVPEELDAWVSLCVLIAKVTEALNSSPWADINAYDRRLMELADELDACFEHLPTRLRYEEGNAFELEACAYGLNIQHFGLRIVIHRNAIRVRQERRSELHGSTSQHGVEHGSSQHQLQSAHIAHQNALRVARLIRTFKQIFGVEKIVTIMLDNIYVASTALISHILSYSPANNTNRDKDIQWLRSLSETLDEVRKFYPITIVMISTLSRLVEGTSLSGIFSTGRSGSTTSKDSPTAGLAALSMPPLSMAGWGSREAFMGGFSFDMEPVLDTNFSVDDNHTQYFQNPVIGASPPWGMGFPR